MSLSASRCTHRASGAVSIVLAVDRQLRIRSWPQDAAEWFARTGAEVLGKPVAELLGWGSGDPAAASMAAWQPCRFRASSRANDGVATALTVAFEPAHGEDLPFGILHLASELAAASEAEARYQSVIASMQEGVIVIGLDGAILTWNSAAERILRMGPAELAGRSALEPTRRTIRVDGSPFPADEFPGIVTARTGVPQSNVVMGVVGPEGTAWISINAQPIGGPGGPHRAVVSTFIDITDRLEAERRLHEALDSVKALTGLLPVCAWCKSVRNDAGYWQQLEEYLEAHTDARPTHGVCPTCSDKLGR